MQLDKDAYGVLNKIFLFNGISETKKEYLLDGGDIIIRTYEPGKIIYEPDSFSRSLGVIIKGCAVVTTVSGTKKVVLRMLVKNDVFGAASLFGRDEYYVTSIHAKREVRAAFIPQEAVERIITADSAVALNYIYFLSDRVRFLNHKITCFTAGCADSRVARYLLELDCDAEGTVMLPAAYKPLADILGIGRASLYRALDALEENGVIRRDGRNITVLSQDKLRETASQKELP